MKKKGFPLESSSSTSGDRPIYLVGTLGRPHGLDGFLGLYVDEADLSYYEPGRTVFIDGRPLVVRARRRADKGYQIAFEEIVDREGAERIRNLDIYVSRRRELSEEEYWPEDLVGLEVRPAGGEVIGVIHGPSQDRLVIERDGARFEVPFVDALVPVVDIEQGYVEIVEVEGITGLSGR